MLFLTSGPFKKNSKLQIMASPSFLEFFFVPSKSAISLGNELVSSDVLKGRYNKIKTLKILKF